MRWSRRTGVKGEDWGGKSQLFPKTGGLIFIVIIVFKTRIMVSRTMVYVVSVYTASRTKVIIGGIAAS